MTRHNDVGPLIAGFDPTNASADAIAILTNPELIKVSQDATGVQGRKLVPRPLSALPSQGDAVVIDVCSSSGNTTSAGAGVPKSQGWAWGWPYAGRLGLNAFVVAAGTSDPVPLCLSVSNLTDRDSGRAMLLLDECVAPTAAAAMPSSTTSGQVGNQTFVFNETTHAIVHADSGLCVSKSSYFAKREYGQQQQQREGGCRWLVDAPFWCWPSSVWQLLHVIQHAAQHHGGTAGGAVLCDVHVEQQLLWLECYQSHS